MEDLKNIIDDKIKSLGLTCFSIDYKDKTLTIKLDGEDLSIDNIVKATKIINPIIDRNNLIEESYILDVCSKGEQIK